MRWWLHFVRARTLWLLAIPPIVLVGIALHELIHAAAVLALGGEIAELQLFPDLENGTLELGHVLHHGSASPRLVAAAPTLVWLVVAIASAIIANRTTSQRRATALLLLGVAAPLLDVSASFGGFFLRIASADLSIALAGWAPAVNAGFAIAFVTTCAFFYGRTKTTTAAPPSAIAFTTGFALIALVPWLVWA